MPMGPKEANVWEKISGKTVSFVLTTPSWFWTSDLEEDTDSLLIKDERYGEKTSPCMTSSSSLESGVAMGEIDN